MKKIIISIIVTFFLWINFAYAWLDMWNSIWDINSIKNVSNNEIWSWDALSRIKTWWTNVLHTIKVIFSWVILAYLVFLGFQMIMAMWAEDKLTTAKRQIYYTLIAFLFINVPGALYDTFWWKTVSDVTDKNASYTNVKMEWTSNTIVNFDIWNSTVENGVINFIKIIVVALVIMQFMMAWIWLISSAWNDEKRKKARTRFLNWIYGLIFIWIIQAWIWVVYSWDIPKWQWIFAQISNLWIFFAWPIAIFFLILWWFYYITSAWDEAKAKKWMMIIKNTVVAVVILLACYAFLKDLSNFSL